MSRHRDALAIQQGACNPSGIAHSIIDACREMRDEGYDTRRTCNDPALRLMVHQLAFICGIISGAEELARAPTYAEATAECTRRSADEPRPVATTG